MLSLTGITKTYLGRKVVDDVSFDIARGEVVGLLGANGAGKTTIMRMIAGILEPDRGTIICDGQNMWTQRMGAQALIGYLPEGAPLYDDMTAKAYLDFMCDTRAVTKSKRRDLIASATHRTSLDSVLHQPIETMSKGFRRRVALAGAIVHDPPILILDEPSDGLDPNQKRAARALIGELRHQRVILLSTHNLDDVSASCSRILVLNRGRVIADQTPQVLAASAPSGRMEDAFCALTEPPL
jgi:ABC-2 type transport system ATP-binding protein